MDTLPVHLQERICHRLGAHFDPERPGPVVYWMRVAVRDHENPALELALEVAAQLDRDLWVYHGLDERYPYASDRHHRFILEGAQDVARGLAEKGIPYLFHLSRPGHRGQALKDLASRASLVVTDEFPLLHHHRWALAVSRSCPLWTVDASCAVPMSSTSKAYTRAFAFEIATEQPRHATLSHTWRTLTPHRAMHAPTELSFTPVNLDETHLDALISTCEIDHGVGPVPHTKGGSAAGYSRWEHFRASRLSTYKRHRNNPLEPSSRMSAYLHYGHVSPFRLARHATRAGTSGEAWCRQLLVWRELAWHWCFHTLSDEMATLNALPAWAQETWSAHLEDPRPAHLDWERLALARSGDALWDAAQRSLLQHGELHNNVRMTWCKALQQWARTPQDALSLALDLNDRFALDGRDPVSLCSILWCFGLFDRPFTPAQPIIGKTRLRSLDRHRSYLDVDAYNTLTRQCPWQPTPRVAIIGAGMAGLSCGQTLTRHGWQVKLFDKGRGPGGRSSTRRHGDQRFDHSARALTARDPQLQRHIRAWAQQGHVREWPELSAHLGHTAWVGVPGMNAIIKHMAQGLDVDFGTRVASIDRTGHSWRLLDMDGLPISKETFDWVLVATPAPQAAPLLSTSPHLSAAAAQIEMEPCWTLMFSLECADVPETSWYLLENHPSIAWACMEQARPGRVSSSGWVVQAHGDWSRAHLEADKMWIAENLLDDFCTLAQLDPKRILFSNAHRWRFAFSAQLNSTGLKYLYDEQQQLGACGDWCHGTTDPFAGLEHAWCSGRALAGRLLHTAPSQMAEPYPAPKPSQPSLFPL
ncbi:MAG: FAD-dependent oxidoreductase [Bradymonadia bacterium]